MNTHSTLWPEPRRVAEITTWIDSTLADGGIHRRGDVRQVRLWARALLLTLDTDRGRMWVKAVPEIFAHEVAVTMLLADVDPGCVPPVVAADAALGRIITEHVDGPVLATMPDQAEAWAATLSRLAEAQRVLAVEPTALAIAGVAAAPVRRLADAVPRLLADDDLLRTERPDGLSAQEVGAIRSRLAELVDACHALAASGVPDSLEHGDLTGDEVIIGEMGPVFLDWSDGSVTHPFLSAASLLSGGPTSEDRVTAYLAPWLTSGVITDPAGRAALADARTVLPLHLAALYADRILPALGGDERSDPKVIVALRTLVQR